MRVKYEKYSFKKISEKTYNFVRQNSDSRTCWPHLETPPRGLPPATATHRDTHLLLLRLTPLADGPPCSVLVRMYWLGDARGHPFSPCKCPAYALVVQYYQGGVPPGANLWRVHLEDVTAYLDHSELCVRPGEKVQMSMFEN